MEIWHIQRNEEKTGYPEGTCKRLKPLWSAAEHLEPTLSVLRALPQTEGKRTKRHKSRERRVDAAVGAPTAQGVVWFHSEANCRQLRRNGVNSKATHTLVHTHARAESQRQRRCL